MGNWGHYAWAVGGALILMLVWQHRELPGGSWIMWEIVGLSGWLLTWGYVLGQMWLVSRTPERCHLTEKKGKESGT